MIRHTASKVMWVGRATVFSVGLVAIFALMAGAAYMAFTALSGSADRPSVIPQQLQGGGADQVLSVDPLAVRRVPTQGYAQVLPNCTSATPSVCTFEDSKAVKGVIRTTPTASATVASLYCFDLAFTPHIAVASPYINNNAVIATAAREDVPSRCTAPYNDAAARTYAANTGEERQDIGFAIEFR
jgi:hypothetical protein